MNENEKLLEIKKELEQTAEKLAAMFSPDHPKWNDVFEDTGAGGYYIQEAVYRIEAAIKTVQENNAYL